MTLRTPQGVLSSRSLSFPPSMMPLSQSGILAFTSAGAGANWVPQSQPRKGLSVASVA